MLRYFLETFLLSNVFFLSYFNKFYFFYCINFLLEKQPRKHTRIDHKSIIYLFIYKINSCNFNKVKIKMINIYFIIN